MLLLLQGLPSPSAMREHAGGVGWGEAPNTPVAASGATHCGSAVPKLWTLRSRHGKALRLGAGAHCAGMHTHAGQASTTREGHTHRARAETAAAQPAQDPNHVGILSQNGYGHYH